MENNNVSNINNYNNNICNEDLASIFGVTNMGDAPNINEPILDDLLLTTQTNNYIHLHTEMFPPVDEKKANYYDGSTQLVEKCNNKKRGRRNRRDNKEAVSRYHKKVKAKEVELEDEVKKLKVLNQELMKRLEVEAAMQDEITLLKCLLVDIRGRIEGEAFSFRYHNPINNACFNGCGCGVNQASNGGLNKDLNCTSSLGDFQTSEDKHDIHPQVWIIASKN